MAYAKVYSIHLPCALIAINAAWKFQWHPALKPQGGVCTANLTPSFLHPLGARLYTASPSRLHRTTDLSSFAFSWLVRSYVGLSFRPYTAYATARKAKNFYLVPPTVLRIPGAFIFSPLRILHNYPAAGTAEASVPRRWCVLSSVHSLCVFHLGSGLAFQPHALSSCSRFFRHTSALPRALAVQL